MNTVQRDANELMGIAPGTLRDSDKKGSMTQAMDRKRAMVETFGPGQNMREAQECQIVQSNNSCAGCW